ncbi:transposase [Streptococcus pneumoniae]|nr:transposase [Streptococcus pneumoniae]VIX50267.1 transposase [Streptococcus pneumoniae]
MVAGLTNGELIAPMTYEEMVTSDFFEAWFQKFLLPTLTTPSVIIMDNARFHRMGKLARSLGMNFYLFLPTHLSTILLRKHGLISKRYYQVAIPFTSLFCLVLVSIDYIRGETFFGSLSTVVG